MDASHIAISTAQYTVLDHASCGISEMCCTRRQLQYQQIAAAMIDRLIHHGYLLVFHGENYRMTHVLMRRDTPSG